MNYILYLVNCKKSPSIFISIFSLFHQKTWMSRVGFNVQFFLNLQKWSFKWKKYWIIFSLQLRYCLIHAELWALDNDWHIFWSILRVCHSEPPETEAAQIKYHNPDWEREYSVHFVSVSWLLKSVIMFKFCGSCWNLFNYKQPWLTGVLQLSVVLYKLSAQVKIFLYNSHSDFN